jgi:putative glutathione S-transferase
MRNLKGLENHIGLSIVHPTLQLTKPEEDQHSGWVFRNPTDPPVIPISGYGSIPCDGCIPDHLYNSQTARQLYEMSGDTAKKYSVPILWDKESKTIVNNESSEIIRMMNTAFNHLDGVSQKDFYPTESRAEIDSVNEWVYSDINNGVYKCGFAKSQEAYEEAAGKLFAALDRVEGILATQK